MTRRRCCGRLLGGAAALFLSACGRGASVPGDDVGRGVALRGRVRLDGGAADLGDGVVVIGSDGRVAAIGPRGSVVVPDGVRELSGAWVGPGVVDAHVHLAFGGPDTALAGGLVGVRDLGAPPPRARDWRTGESLPDRTPHVAVAGPLLTAPGGYPSTTWGADGFTRAVESPEAARRAVRDLSRDGVDLVKIALEPAGGLPVPSLEEVRAVVDAAHAQGLPVTAHALVVPMVRRALDAGVDELCHTPVEPLPADLVERIADAGVPVVSTLQTFFATGNGASAGANAKALVAAGVRLVYGTDLGNGGTRPGVDPRELDRIADAGLGREGALRSATEWAATAAGARGTPGRVAVGEPAALALLAEDPVREPATWRDPVALVLGTRLITRTPRPSAPVP